MALSWDRRVVSERVLEILARAQDRVPFRIAGGAALSGVHLRHRLSRDVDLFFEDRRLVRELKDQLAEVAHGAGATFRSVRDAGTFVRGELELDTARVELDLVYEPSAPAAVSPLPNMLVALSIEQLSQYRDELARRFRAAALPAE